MNEVIWHDLECGHYQQDLPLWLELADDCGGPVLDVGAGTGRVSLALAQAGIEVLGLDREARLLSALRERAADLAVRTVVADAREFSLGERFALIIVSMQTIQLLGGTDGRRSFLRCAREHLADGGALAIAIAATDDFEEFQWHPGDPSPSPDVSEHDGARFSSQPTAVRREGETFVLERSRSVSVGGRTLTTEDDQILLDVLTVGELDAEAADCGLELRERRLIDATAEHIGSQVVIARA